MDLRPGVSAGESAHRHSHARPVKGGAGQGEQASAGIASGAADGEDALRLRIQVQHLPALQRGDVDGGRPQQADLLVHGEHRLQTGVRQALRVQKGQGHRYGDAVISPQGGALGIDKVPVHRQVQPLPAHVLLTVGGLLTDHIQMSLKDHRGRGLIAGRGLLDDDDIVVPVLVVLQSPGPGEVRAPVADGLGVPGAVGDSAHLLKKTEHAFGFQMLQYVHSLKLLSENRYFLSR